MLTSPRRHQPVLGVDLTGDRLHDSQQAVAFVDQHRHDGADQSVRDRVAGRPEPDTREFVDLPGDRLRPDLQPQRRQPTQQLDLGLESFSRDCMDLAVLAGVDLLTPRHCADVEPGDALSPWVLVEVQRHQQVVLGVADQVLHDALGLRIRAVTEVGSEPVMGREPDVVRRGHDDVGDHAAFQAAHPVREYDLRDAAENLEALGQHRQGGGLLLISGEPDEPEPRPGQHRAEPWIFRPATNSSPRSIARTSPGDHTAGPRPLVRAWPCRHARLASATSRRKLRSEPS